MQILSKTQENMTVSRTEITRQTQTPTPTPSNSNRNKNKSSNNNNTKANKHVVTKDRSQPIPSCRIFRPTAEEFKYPYEYIRKIRPEAEKTGM